MRWIHSVKQSWLYDRQITGALLGLVLLILLLPMRWIVAAAIAAFLHELGHCIALKLFGGSFHRIKIGISGAVIEASGLTPGAEIMCLLAGPLAGLLPMITVRLFPTIAICGLVQSAYNLIPVYPLDGGRILRLFILMHGGTNKLFYLIEYFAILLLLLLCIYVQLRFRCSFLLFFVIFLLRKTPCKLRKDWI